MSDTAPWLDYQQPSAAPPASQPVSATADNAPWLAYQTTTPASPSANSWGNQISDWGTGVKNAWNTLANRSGSATDMLTAAPEAVASLATSAVAPLSAGVQQGINLVTGQPLQSYSQLKQENTYQPSNPMAQDQANLIGNALKPVGDALNSVAGAFTSDPETKAAIADSLAYAVPGLKSVVKVGPAAAEDIATQAPSIANHPAVMAANDLAGKYDINLTKGQMVQQAATGVADTAKAKALAVPYQIEAATADTPTNIGKSFNTQYATQQDTLAGHVQDVATALRAAGEDDAADSVEGTIKPISPGVNAVSGPKLQRVVNRDLIDDPTLSAKLNDLNDLSGLIDPPAFKGPIADSGVVSKLASKVSGGTIGGLAGGLAGHSVAPGIGTWIGSGLGERLGEKYLSPIINPAVSKLVNGFQTAGQVNLDPLSNSDLAPAAKELGIRPDELATELQKPENLPVIKPAKVMPQGRYVGDQYIGANGETPAAPGAATPGAPAAQGLGPTQTRAAAVAPPTASPTAPIVQQAPIISTPTQAAQSATQNIYDQLHNGKLSVTFNKVGDGTERTMQASLHDDYLPDNYKSGDAKHPQLIPGKPLVVWDTENNGWRSFHPSTVKSIEAIQ